MEIEVLVVLPEESFVIRKDFTALRGLYRTDILAALEKCYLAAKRFVEESIPD